MSQNTTIYATILITAVFLGGLAVFALMHRKEGPRIPLPKLGPAKSYAHSVPAQSSEPKLCGPGPYNETDPMWIYNNPSVYQGKAQVALWPNADRVQVGWMPNDEEGFISRMSRPVEQLDWNQFWRPIPDPMKNSRAVYFSDDPVTQGLRSNIVETGMSSGHPLTGRGGYPGY